MARRKGRGRGSAARLRKYASKAYNKVARASGHKRCGTGRGGRRVCLSTEKIAGMKCGRNPINKLYACAKK